MCFSEKMWRFPNNHKNGGGTANIVRSPKLCGSTITTCVLCTTTRYVIVPPHILFQTTAMCSKQNTMSSCSSGQLLWLQPQNVASTHKICGASTTYCEYSRCLMVPPHVLWFRKDWLVAESRAVGAFLRCVSSLPLQWPTATLQILHRLCI